MPELLNQLDGFDTYCLQKWHHHWHGKRWFFFCLSFFFVLITIYVRDMQINHFFEVTACKSKHYLPKFYIYILHTILHLHWISQICWWRTDAVGQWPNFEAKEPVMQMAVTDKSQAKFSLRRRRAACRWLIEVVGSRAVFKILLLCHAPDLSFRYSAFLNSWNPFLNWKTCYSSEQIST